MASVQYFCCKPIFLKQFLFLIFLLSLHLALLAQKDSVKPVANKTAVAKPSPSLKSVGAIKPKVDSLKKPLLDTARVQQDSTGIKDSLAKQVLLDSLQLDSTKKALQLQILAARPDTSTYAKYLYSKYLPFQGQAIQQFSQERKRDSQELLFYILTGLVGILAAIR